MNEFALKVKKTLTHYEHRGLVALRGHLWDIELQPAERPKKVAEKMADLL